MTKGIDEDKYDKAKCVVCKRKFLKAKKTGCRQLPGDVRGFNCKTCSRRCSRMKTIEKGRKF